MNKCMFGLMAQNFSESQNSNDLSKNPCNKFMTMILNTWRHYTKIGIFDLWLDKNEEDSSLDAKVQEDAHLKDKASTIRLHS